MALVAEPNQQEPPRRQSSRHVLSSVDDVRQAVVQLTSLAERSLSILTHDLEPSIYDHDDFLETLKRFVLGRPFARVRMLILDPVAAMKNGNRFVSMGRRLSSYIELRHAVPQHRNRPEAFCIADDTAVVYRARAQSWEGVADTYQPHIAQLYLKVFDELWYACEKDSVQLGR